MQRYLVLEDGTVYAGEPLGPTRKPSGKWSSLRG